MMGQESIQDNYFRTLLSQMKIPLWDKSTDRFMEYSVNYNIKRKGKFIAIR